MIKKSKSQADLIINMLSNSYPKCFILTEEVKPIKVGILDDVWIEISSQNINLFNVFPTEFKFVVNKLRARNLAIAKSQAKKKNRELTSHEESLSKELSDDEYLVLGALSKTKLRQAMSKYTSSLNYLKSFKLGVKRINLDGSETDEVISAEEVDFAEKRMVAVLELLAKNKERQLKYIENKNKKKNNALLANKEKTKQKINIEKNKHKSDSISTINLTQNINKVEAVKDVKTIPLKTIVLDDIKIGDEIKIKLAQKINQAKVVEIQKDSVKVQLSSGMVISLGIEHIFK